VSVLPVSHFTWQVLRTVKRSKQPPTGKQLRVSPTRRTKDGTFLDELVNEGLLHVVGVDELPAGAAGSEKSKPIQFRTRYKLTPLGEHAAEHGECQRPLVKSVPDTSPEPPRDEPRKATRKRNRSGSGR
jgi:hypothetical protein